MKKLLFTGASLLLLSACQHPEAWRLYVKGLHWHESPRYYNSSRKLGEDTQRRNLKAIELYTKSLELDSTGDDARLHRAQAYQVLGEYSKAQADLLLLTKRAGQQVQALYTLAKVYYEKEDHQASRSILDELIVLMEDQPKALKRWQKQEVYEKQIENLIALNKWNHAVEVLKKSQGYVNRISARNINYSTVKSELFLLAGNLKGARKALASYRNRIRNQKTRSSAQILWVQMVMDELEGLSIATSPIAWPRNNTQKPSLLFENLSVLDLSLESEERLRDIYQGKAVLETEPNLNLNMKAMP